MRCCGLETRSGSLVLRGGRRSSVNGRWGDTTKRTTKVWTFLLLFSSGHWGDLPGMLAAARASVLVRVAVPARGVVAASGHGSDDDGT